MIDETNPDDWPRYMRPEGDWLMTALAAGRVPSLHGFAVIPSVLAQALQDHVADLSVDERDADAGALLRAASNELARVPWAIENLMQALEDAADALEGRSPNPARAVEVLGGADFEPDYRLCVEDQKLWEGQHEAPRAADLERLLE